ncbi:hypothetical protein D3C78_1800130 [compost metagenome]
MPAQHDAWALHRPIQRLRELKNNPFPNLMGSHNQRGLAGAGNVVSESDMIEALIAQHLKIGRA